MKSLMRSMCWGKAGFLKNVGKSLSVVFIFWWG